MDGGDFGVLTPIDHAQLHHPGDFFTKAHAAGAVNAAGHFLGGHQGADILGRNHALFLAKAGAASTVPDRQVLQLALATLVANGAVQRVVDEQKFHDRLLRFQGFFALGAHNHALGHRRSTGGQGFGRFFHLDQAHAAVGRNRQLFVITKVRNVNPGFFSRMHHHAARGDFDFFTV